MELIHWLETGAADRVPPNVELDGLGRSAPTRARNVGVAAAPEDGPDHTALADCVARTAVRLPDVVIGLTVTVKIPGRESPTDVTEPEPAGDQIGSAPAPCVVKA